MKRGMVLLVMCMFFSVVLRSQLSIPVSGVSATIDFTGFDGSGFAPSPGMGQLDSDTWSTDGFGDDSPFSGTCTSGDCARGLSTGGSGTGGVYAFDIAGDIALGVQPGGSDFTPGDFTLAVINNTGTAITTLNVDYIIAVFNDQDRANSFNFAYSFDDASYTLVPSFDYTSTETGAGMPEWETIIRSGSIPLSAPLNDGSTIYLRWQGNDVSGSGARDEFAIDDIVVADGSTVPVTYTSIKAMSGLDYNSITWTTATEVNNDFFEIQHSRDGNSFITIGSIQGNNSYRSDKNYHFNHLNPEQGLHYYRLKQVDFDGRYSISETVKTLFLRPLEVRLVPNRVLDEITIQHSIGNTATLRILDMTGRIHYTSQVRETTIQLDVAHLPKGYYVVQMFTKQEMVTKPLIKL